jgi:hypothetical protein
MHHAHHHAHRASLAVSELAASFSGLALEGASGAAPADLRPPHKDEAPRLAGAEGFTDQGKAYLEIIADLDGQRKVFLTLRARHAMAGFALLELSDGSLLATRWNLCRALPGATAVHRFLWLIGGAV